MSACVAEPMPEPEMVTLGDLIRAERLERGIGQRAAATLLGVGQPQVARWEAGVRPGAPMFPRIAEFLRLPCGKVAEIALGQTPQEAAVSKYLSTEAERPDTGPAVTCTTAELLEEVAWRMARTQNSNKGRDLGTLAEEAACNLSPGVLDYRAAEAR